MKAARIEILAGATWRQLVSSDKRKIGAVDEQLVLGGTHRKDVGDVIVRHGVAVAAVFDEAVDGAQAIHEQPFRAPLMGGSARVISGGTKTNQALAEHIEKFVSDLPRVEVTVEDLDLAVPLLVLGARG